MRLKSFPILARCFKYSIILAFMLNCLGPLPQAQAADMILPKPGTRVSLSPPMEAITLKGLKVFANDPFKLEFIMDKGDSAPQQEQLNKLIKYFLAGLTTPEQDLWVNLSPYEKDRIIPEAFGQTEMGRDLLAQDYILKQITASLMYPEDEIGKKFWKKIYDEAAKKYGTTNIPVNTFNKVWIVPEKAEVYEGNSPVIPAKEQIAYITESKLKVMLESDYLAITKNNAVSTGPVTATPYKSSELGKLAPPVYRGPVAVPPVPISQKNNSEFSKNIIREIILPALETEINEGKNFAQLRQVYNSLILATWYKNKIKSNIIAKQFVNQNKIEGISFDSTDAQSLNIEKIYQQYLMAFKKGATNLIREEQDPITHQMIPRKYFSGGVTVMNLNVKTSPNRPVEDLAMVAVHVDFNGGSRNDVEESIMASPYRKSSSAPISVSLGSGADLMTTLSSELVSQVRLGIERKTKKVGLGLEYGVDYKVTRTQLEDVAFSEDLKTFIRKNHKEHGAPLVILDWGCGRGFLLNDIYRWAKQNGFTNILLFGLSDQYYAEWEVGFEGITYIWDDSRNIDKYFEHNSIDLLITSTALTHSMRLKPLTTAVHLLDLNKITKSGGQMMVYPEVYPFERKYLEESGWTEIKKGFVYGSNDDAMTTNQIKEDYVGDVSEKGYPWMSLDTSLTTIKINSIDEAIELATKIGAVLGSAHGQGRAHRSLFSSLAGLKNPQIMIRRAGSDFEVSISEKSMPFASDDPNNFSKERENVGRVFGVNYYLFGNFYDSVAKEIKRDDLITKLEIAFNEAYYSAFREARIERLRRERIELKQIVDLFRKMFEVPDPDGERFYMADKMGSGYKVHGVSIKPVMHDDGSALIVGEIELKIIGDLKGPVDAPKNGNVKRLMSAQIRGNEIKLVLNPEAMPEGVNVDKFKEWIKSRFFKFLPRGIELVLDRSNVLQQHIIEQASSTDYIKVEEGEGVVRIFIDRSVTMFDFAMGSKPIKNGSPKKMFDGLFGLSNVKQVLNFMGIDSLSKIAVDGVDSFPQQQREDVLLIVVRLKDGQTKEFYFKSNPGFEAILDTIQGLGIAPKHLIFSNGGKIRMIENLAKGDSLYDWKHTFASKESAMNFIKEFGRVVGLLHKNNLVDTEDRLKREHIYVYKDEQGRWKFQLIDFDHFERNYNPESLDKERKRYQNLIFDIVYPRASLLSDPKLGDIRHNFRLKADMELAFNEGYQQGKTDRAQMGEDMTRQGGIDLTTMNRDVNTKQDQNASRFEFDDSDIIIGNGLRFTIQQTAPINLQDWLLNSSSLN